jgi:hypothetical protein
VPQGAVLSPALYNLYIAPLPPPGEGCLDIIYADDITQLIICPYKNKENLIRHTKHEIERINNFERNWKIKTNPNKFQVITIAQISSPPLIVEGKHQEYSKGGGSILGMKITSTGFAGHAKDRVKKAKAALGNLYRFKNLSLQKKRTLYTAMVRSILEYPPIPNHTLSMTQIRKMQTVQNAATRFITNIKRTDRKTSEFIHQEANLEPINIVLNKRARKIWERIQLILPETYENLHRGQEQRKRKDFPSSLKSLQEPETPIYS